MALSKSQSIAPKAADRDNDDAAVSSCISNIIHAFTNGLSVFKRLRERRRKRKARKGQRTAESEQTRSSELQLSNSLRKGPQDLAVSYDRYAQSGIGHRFAKGDDIAHATLAQTLIKLNTGLVSIITAFLSHDEKSSKGKLDLDYKSLTRLSDKSREEALMSMTQLYQRLSQSQLNLYKPAVSTPDREKERHDRKDKSKKSSSSSNSRPTGPVVTRMPIKTSSQPQLVVMRPKASRKSSSGSTNTSSSQSSSNSSRNASPLASPLPKYERKDRIDSFDIARPTTWPNSTSTLTTASTTATATSYVQYTSSTLPTYTSNSSRHRSTRSPMHPAAPMYPTSPQYPASPTSPKSPMSPPLYKRRLDKATPSSYTFASDSTKLGEIPQRNWTQPWDYENAERMNREVEEAAAAGIPVVEEEGKEGKKKGKKMFGFLRKERG